jgi:hypothetical protein
MDALDELCTEVACREDDGHELATRVIEQEVEGRSFVASRDAAMEWSA